MEGAKSGEDCGCYLLVGSLECSAKIWMYSVAVVYDLLDVTGGGCEERRGLWMLIDGWNRMAS